MLGKKYEPMPITIFRKNWLDKGYDLVDISKLCEFRLGGSGWCNDFNEPDEPCYHIQVYYRNECIGILDILEKPKNFDEKYIIFLDDGDFIIFKKCKVENK